MSIRRQIKEIQICHIVNPMDIIHITDAYTDIIIKCNSN